MKCNNCGKEVPDSEMFCTHCGASLKQQHEDRHKEQMESEYQQSVSRLEGEIQRVKSAKQTTNIVVCILAVISLILMIVGIRGCKKDLTVGMIMLAGMSGAVFLGVTLGGILANKRNNETIEEKQCELDRLETHWKSRK